VRLNRLRRGEWIALIGSVGLFVVMFLNWYDGHVLVQFGGVDQGPATSIGHHSGWAAVGWLAAACVVAAVGVCGYWLLATVTHDSPAIPVAGEVITIGLGMIASIALLSRLVFQPGLGVGFPNEAVDLLLPAYLGPLLAITLTVGAWLATADERTEAPYSQPGEIELRPLPE
jgi:hypothetical protein